MRLTADMEKNNAFIVSMNITLLCFIVTMKRTELASRYISISKVLSTSVIPIHTKAPSYKVIRL